MPRPLPPPTSDQQRQIVAYIRAGGFPHVAAAAVGASGRTVRRWLRRRDPACRAFAVAVRAAAAQARLRAELALLDAKPLDWLRYGPGKETAGRPGWTSAVRAAARGTAGAVNALDAPEFRAFVAELSRLLADRPDVRDPLLELVTGAKKCRRTRAVRDLDFLG
jgi:hypothetical protein